MERADPLPALFEAKACPAAKEGKVGTMEAEEKIEVAPLRIGTAIKGWVLIYGLTIVTNFILNAWMKAAPMGPWTGDQIMQWYWFDNVCYMLLALWWCFFFVACENWPFAGIENNVGRGVILTVVCWVLGWFSYKAIYWLGLGAGWAFPIIATAYFLLVFIAYTGEMWLIGTFSPHRKFFILLVLIVGLTWLITNTHVRWVPPWWFPIAQMGLATGLFAYLFRGMNQPSKSVLIWLLMFSAVGLWLLVASRVGIWNYKAEGISKFWNIGIYDDPKLWLLMFMIGCSFIYGVLVPLHNWPFTKIPMPWGGIIASVACAVLVLVIWFIMRGLIGTVFADINSALTYGYMGVAWSFFIPLFFGIGFEKPYLWVGQKTPGTWEDVD